MYSKIQEATTLHYFITIWNGRVCEKWESDYVLWNTCILYIFVHDKLKKKIKVYFNMNTFIFKRQCTIESCKRLSMRVCQNFMRLSIRIIKIAWRLKKVITWVTMDMRNAWVTPCSIFDILKNETIYNIQFFFG